MTHQPLMCQSVVAPGQGPAPCQVPASRVLVGVHLCGTHDRYWRHQISHGRKIRIHPDRALPLDHRCNSQKPGTHADTGSTSWTCSRCGEAKPIDAFYTYATATGRSPYAECRPCFNQRSKENKHRRLGLERGSSASNEPSAPQREPAPLETVDGRDRPDPAAIPVQDVAVEEVSAPDVDLVEHARKNEETVRRLTAHLEAQQSSPDPAGQPLDPSPLRLLQNDDPRTPTWHCDHSQETVKRCINCQDPRPKHYVLRRGGGGSPPAWRYLCDPCLVEYQAKGLVLVVGVQSTSEDQRQTPANAPNGQVRDETGHYVGATAS